MGLAAPLHESQSNVRYRGIYLCGSEEPAIILSLVSGESGTLAGKKAFKQERSDDCQKKSDINGGEL